MPTTVKTIGEQVVIQGQGSYVKETLVSAPNTTIINRAKVSNSLLSFTVIFFQFAF